MFVPSNRRILSKHDAEDAERAQHKGVQTSDAMEILQALGLSYSFSEQHPGLQACISSMFRL